LEGALSAHKACEAVSVENSFIFSGEKLKHALRNRCFALRLPSGWLNDTSDGMKKEI
jgi:hypothetical protein